MNFLRTLFWIVVTVVVVVFSLRNWTTVTINLYGGLQADAKLPLLLLIAFLIGFLPLYAYHRAMRWRGRRAPAVETPLPPVPVPVAPRPVEGTGAPIPPLSDSF